MASKTNFSYHIGSSVRDNSTPSPVASVTDVRTRNKSTGIHHLTSCPEASKSDLLYGFIVLAVYFVISIIIITFMTFKVIQLKKQLAEKQNQGDQEPAPMGVAQSDLYDDLEEDGPELGRNLRKINEREKPKRAEQKPVNNQRQRSVYLEGYCE